MTVPIALAQMAPKLGDVQANLDRHLELIRQARQQGAELVIFPELGLTGYYLKDLVPTVAARPSPDDPTFAPLLAASHELDIVVGFVEQERRSRYFISGAYLSRGEIVHVHRKVYLPTYRLFDDARFFGAGDTFRAFDTRFGRMGLLICEDAWHLSSAYILWQDGADILVDISASPGYGMASDRPGQLSSELTVGSFLHAYSELLTDFVLYVNRVGIEDGISFWGGSVGVAPDASIICTAPILEESLIITELDLDLLRRSRLRLPTLRDERPDLVLRELGRIRKASTEY